MAKAKQRQSEWGRLNAGQHYGILAVDVDRALASADLGKYEQRLVQAVRERSWGTSARRKKRGDQWPDAAPCKVDLKELAAALGVPYQRLYEARTRLVNAGVIIMDAGGITLNKNADEWIDPATGNSLLKPKALVYATLARTRKNGCASPPDFTSQLDESEQSLSTPGRESHSRSGVTNDYAPALSAFTVDRESHSRSGVTNDYPADQTEVSAAKRLAPASTAPPPDPPIRSRAELDFKIPADKEPSPPLPSSSVLTTREPDDGAVGGLDALATRLFPDDHDLGFALSAFASRFDPAWVEAAAWCAFAGQVARPRPYINACLGRWQARGGIPTDDAAAAETARSASSSADPRDKGARIDDALARIMARQEAKP